MEGGWEGGTEGKKEGVKEGGKWHQSGLYSNRASHPELNLTFHGSQSMFSEASGPYQGMLCADRLGM